MGTTEQTTDAIDVVNTLREYARTKKPGDVLDYVTVEQESGIRMTPDSGCRRLLWRALRLERIEFQTMKDVGVVLSSPTNSADFVRKDVARVLRGAKRSRKRNLRLIEKHGPDSTMPEKDRQFMLAAASFHGAVEAAGASALSANQLPRHEPPPKPQLPLRVVKT